MIPLERAREVALSLVATLGTEVLPLQQARGRFVAQPLLVSRPIPAVDSSAMDGWALRSEESAAATRDQPALFRVRGEAAAGAPQVPELGRGEAVRIFTGALLPAGADAVLRLESGVEVAGELRAFIPARPGDHIRRAGEELPLGAVGLPARSLLDAYGLAVAASLGYAKVEVARPPRVGVITVGDELVRIGRAALPHQVYDSNGVLVAALCVELGVSVTYQTHAADDDGPIRAALEEALEETDLVVTCGGASVGDHDRVKHVLREMGGKLHVDGVLLKPGKPLGVAAVRGKPVVVLPGNPGAAAVGFDQLARPMLLRAQGVTEVRRRLPVRLDAPRHKQAGLE
ncbi:MAG TPA: molybdopterin molybdotransferase MoeA, partial [Myxococcales bacterium]|nr:molybdopterin molybdotransferase MoeA [Myxococcales bacterium]